MSDIKIKTILARDIESENLDIRYDMSVKRVLGNIPLLAPITKYTVKEVEDFSIPMIEKCIDEKSIQISEVFVEPVTINLEKEMNKMCNLSSGIREDGFRDGKREGELNTLRNLLKANITTIEKLKESGLYSNDILAALNT